MPCFGASVFGAPLWGSSGLGAFLGLLFVGAWLEGSGPSWALGIRVLGGGGGGGFKGF